MKKIAVDLDGVVFDTENLYRVYTEIYDVEKFNKDSLVDNSQRIYQKRYNWSDEENDRFYNLYAHEILENGNVMTGADIVLKKLSSNYEIIVVTSRKDDEVIYAKNFFDSIGLNNIKIYNNQISKIDIFLEENVSYIIDDDKDICELASKNNINALYFKNAAADKIEENEYLKIVNNWGEIYKYISLRGE